MPKTFRGSCQRCQRNNASWKVDVQAVVMMANLKVCEKCMKFLTVRFPASKAERLVQMD